MNNDKNSKFVVSLKNKANERIVCSRRECAGITFVGTGSGFQCLKCGHIYRVSELDFVYWELCGNYPTQAFNSESEKKQK